MKIRGRASLKSVQSTSGAEWITGASARSIIMFMAAKGLPGEVIIVTYNDGFMLRIPLSDIVAMEVG